MTWVAVGVGGATLIGSLVNTFAGPGSGDQNPKAGTTDPRSILMAALTGANLGFNEDTGTFGYRGGSYQQSPFGANSDLMWHGMLDPTMAGSAAKAVESGTPSTSPSALETSFQHTLDQLDAIIGPGQDQLMKLVETGNPVSIDPIVQSRLYDFNNKFMPGLLERLPGGNLDNSYQSSLAAQEGGRVSSELGVLDYNAQEAARARQQQAVTQGVPAYSTLVTSRGLLPSAYAHDLYGLSDLERGDRPGSQLWNAMQSILGITPGPNVTSAAQPSQSSQILGAMSSAIPALTKVIGGAIPSGGGTGGGGTAASGYDYLTAPFQ